MVSTSDFPQADKLMQVEKAVKAISQGKKSSVEIGNALGLVKRQGDYYRQAAQVLGLVELDKPIRLTRLGEEYLNLNSEPEKKDFLARCIADAEVFKKALNYIDANQPDKQELKNWYLKHYPAAKVTAERRFSTFISYIQHTSLVESKNNRLALKKFTGTIKKKSVTLPLVQKVTFKAPAVMATKGFIRADIDWQKHERANQIHAKLINAKSAFLHDKGFLPQDTKHIDLFSDTENGSVLYEMKSVQDSQRNVLSQIRKAIAQLYEYRYLYKMPADRLCIVTNLEISAENEWLSDYLIKERGIAYVWTKDFISFECSADSRKLLGPFAP